LNLVDKLGPSKVAFETGIPESSLRRWRKNGISKTAKGGRKPAFPEVERELLVWFKDMRNRGYSVTNGTLFNEALKLEDFIGSQSWLNGFKIRSRIVYRRADPLKISSPISTNDLLELHNYALESIVNIDESGLAFDSFNPCTLEFKVPSFLSIHVS